KTGLLGAILMSGLSPVGGMASLPDDGAEHKPGPPHSQTAKLRRSGVVYSTFSAFTSIAGAASFDTSPCCLRARTTSATHPVHVGSMSVKGTNSSRNVGNSSG